MTETRKIKVWVERNGYTYINGKCFFIDDSDENKFLCSLFDILTYIFNEERDCEYAFLIWWKNCFNENDFLEEQRSLFKKAKEDLLLVGKDYTPYFILLTDLEVEKMKEKYDYVTFIRKCLEIILNRMKKFEKIEKEYRKKVEGYFEFDF